MGPLEGIRVIELAAIGPAPFAAMVLADLGAEVVRIDRPEPVDLGLPDRAERKFDVVDRGRRSLAVDLKAPAGRDLVLALAAKADVLIEGFRPGVIERLGLSPDRCLTANPRLVLGRVTGFGQDGPLSQRAGHDINYIALSGVLAAIGPSPEGPPTIPLNLIGDFGGGGMVLAMGVLAAVIGARATGRGQVVDASMIDGAAYLSAMLHGAVSAGNWSERRASNSLDGGAPWYGVYETADGGYMAVGAIEGRFYQTFLTLMGLSDESLPAQHDRTGWPVLRARFAEVFRTRTRAEWDAHFAGTDACVTPVLGLSEAARHPHNAARGTFVERDGVCQPVPAPRFGSTPARPGPAAREPGSDSRAVLSDWGLEAAEIDRLIASGAVVQRS